MDSEDVTEMSETQANSEEVVVLPHDYTPRKTVQSPYKICSSFLGQAKAGQLSPHRGPHPLSPGSKALDKVLSKHSSPSPVRGSGAQRRLQMDRTEREEVSVAIFLVGSSWFVLCDA